MSEEEDEDIYGLEKAVENAWKTLSEQSADEIVQRTHCMLGETSDTFVIKFLGDEYTIQTKENKITTDDGKPFFNLFKIGIILHYLVHASVEPLKNKYISFRELWGGNEYYYAFNNRVLVPLLEHFKKQPDNLIKASQAIGGEIIEKGEYGLTIPALPRVPVTILFWTGDDEVQPSANVLFDASANAHMETEALVWLAIATVGDLRKI